MRWSSSIFIRNLTITTALASLRIAGAEDSLWALPAQVIVIANMGPQPFPNYDIPGWRWGNSALTEIGYSNTTPTYNPMTGALSLSLNPFEARILVS